MSQNTIKHNTVKTPSQISQQNTNIAIVDNFNEKLIFVDWDNTPDIPHGKVVEKFIQGKLPGTKIDEFEVKPCDEKSFVNAMDNVINNIKNGKQYNAMNLSMSDNISFKGISNAMGKTITPQNLKEHKTEIKDWLKNLKPNDTVIEQKPFGSCSDITNKTLKFSYDGVIKKLEQISSSGTKIYVSAGNHGKDYFNLASLADNVTTVGSTDLQGKKSTFSADNSLVSNWTQGEYKIYKIKDKNNNTGYDFTQDGKIDLSTQKTSSFFKFTNDNKIEGTSFSTPKKLADDLSK